MLSRKKVILWVYVNILYFDVEQGNEAKLLLCTSQMRFKILQVIALESKTGWKKNNGYYAYEL